MQVDKPFSWCDKCLVRHPHISAVIVSLGCLWQMLIKFCQGDTANQWVLMQQESVIGQPHSPAQFAGGWRPSAPALPGVPAAGHRQRSAVEADSVRSQPAEQAGQHHRRSHGDPASASC